MPKFRSRHRSPAQRGAALVLALAAVAGISTACTEAMEGERTSESPTSGPTPLCTVGEPTRQTFRVAGQETYIEPQNFLETPEGLLLAGVPTFEWVEPRVPGVPPITDRLVGVFLDGGEVRPILAPEGVGPTLAAVRVAYEGPERLSWLLHRTETRDSVEAGELFAGEWWKGDWGDLEVLDFEGATPHLFSSSTLLPGGGPYRWLVPVATASARSAVFAFDEDPVSRTPVPALVDVVAMASGPDGARWSAVGGLVASSAPEGYARALRVWRHPEAASAPEWRWSTSHENDLVLPTLSARGGAVHASWIVKTPTEPPQGWAAMRVGAPDGPAPVEVDSAAAWIVPVALADGAALWITHSGGAGDRLGDLRIYRLSAAGSPEAIHTMPYPYSGYHAAVATAGGELVIVGPEYIPDPANPVVRSLLLRFHITCT